MFCATPFNKYHRSPLGLALKLQSDANFYSSIEILTKSEPDAIQLRTVSEVEFSIDHVETSENQDALNPVDFFGRIERNWWLSSFSSLTRLTCLLAAKYRRCASPLAE